MASSFAKSFRSSSHLLPGLPALLWVFVDLLSPGFHSAAFLVHLSWNFVAIRIACRHFSFFCVSTQFVMPYVSIFLSFFHASFHVFNLQDCPHGLLCFLHRRRMKCCCLGRLHHVCCLLLEYPRLFHRLECLFLQVSVYFCIFSLSG